MTDPTLPPEPADIAPAQASEAQASPSSVTPQEPPAVELAPSAHSEAALVDSATPSPAEPAAAPPATEFTKQSIIVRYGVMLNTGQFRHDLDTPPRFGQKVVVRTERGVELGEVMAPVTAQRCEGCTVTAGQLQEFLRCNGPEFPFHRNGRVLRLANSQDEIDHRHLQEAARDELAFCRQHAEELKLPMKLVSVEHLLGGERIIFYFTSESRVDFRELVRRVATEYRTRIEMRQVGARDEARLVADYERCGQRCCCQQFLKDLRPVSMRMAKTQKATLDPSKISGRCGRLMCCLRYEDAGYEELRKRLPPKNIWVRTADVVGRVVETQILTQLVRVEKFDGVYVVVSNEAILERDVPRPTAEEHATMEEAQRRAQSARAAEQRKFAAENSPFAQGRQAEPSAEAQGEEELATEVVAEGSPGEAGAPPPRGQGEGEGRRRRRRGRRRRGRPGGGEAAASDPRGTPQSQSGADSDAPQGDEAASPPALEGGGNAAALTSAPGNESGAVGPAVQSGAVGGGHRRRRRRRRRH